MTNKRRPIRRLTKKRSEMIKDDKDRLTKLEDVVEYQITTLPDRRWHIFFFTRQGETKKLAGPFRDIDLAIDHLKAAIADS